jgi:adenylylsulfate kinase
MSDLEPGFALWFTGLPSSGKSTVARALARRLAAAGVHTQLLDSDELRRVLTPDPAYTPAERDWFYGVLVYIAGLLVDNGVNVLLAATASRRRYRAAARARFRHFAEVFVACPPALCCARDPKGLWARAAAGDISDLPGYDAPYEEPEHPEVRLDTEGMDVAAAVDAVWAWLRDEGLLPP